MSTDCVPSILVVNNELDKFTKIATLLSGEYRLHHASGGHEAINKLDHYQPDVILLDIVLPGTDGLEVCRYLKAALSSNPVPIIMITVGAEQGHLANCIAAGADDFISSPLHQEELRARVQSMLRIRQQYKRLSESNQHLSSTVEYRTSELYTRIFQDPLTHLPSRAYLLQHLSMILQESNHPFALVNVGCDRFKLINGSLGHDIGDVLLHAISQRLRQYLQPCDLLVRVGEDEFCFYLDEVADETVVVTFVQKIMRGFDEAFAVAGFEIYMTACAGIVLRRSEYSQPQQPLQDADTAMYQAKLQGKGRYQIFDHHMHQHFIERLTLENSLRHALDREEFVNYYQPIIHLETGQITGFEALVRWLHPDLGLVSPGKFIPCMEETGLIVPVGMVVLQLACQQLRRWHEAGWRSLTVSVNLSVRQFAHTSLISDIDQVILDTGIFPESLRLEITESAIMEDARSAIELTQALRARRMQLSIDDFGTGYSSLGYLNQFPIDSLKIDREFVKDIGTPDHKPEILQAIVRLGETLGLNLVAEGIETPEQRTHLQALGIQYGQGYLFGKPLDSEKSTSFLERFLPRT